jgi:hypothetical protein
MKLTKENFLQHFDTGQKFYVANQTKIDVCYPIQSAEFTGNHAAFSVSTRIISFSREHLYLETHYLRDIFAGSCFTTIEEAKEVMRIAFCGLIEHYNKHEFKDTPIRVAEDK